MSDMRVYVGTYHKYNCGSIAGEWLDIDDYADADEFYAACAELHKDEADPEYMFQDWEGFPEGMIGESYIDKEVFELAQLSDDDFELLTVYREDVNQDGTIEQARDDYLGTYDSADDYAEEFHTECGDLASVPESLRGYIDWEAVARDMRCSGVNFVNHDGKVWVFSS